MIVVYTDGASQGNPGPSGAGIFIQNGGETFTRSVPLPDMSNHEAEFHAVRHALWMCKKHFPGEILSFRSDSKIVVESIEKRYSRNQIFIPILNEILKLMESFPYVFFKWIPNEKNHHADRLAREAIRKT